MNEEMRSVLADISSSQDVKKLNLEQMKILSSELREEIISTVKKNGGHLSPNLGVVETTLALYKHFDFPKDKLIFDVGHQCYAHKILSGRKDKFSSLRLEGGLSGFPDILESEYDAFSVGHAGTSVSAALGYCHARDIKGEDYAVVVMVGDGALSNGLNMEAFTTTTEKPKNLIVILNDNGMSISKNKNGFYHFLSKRTTKKGYRRSKRMVKKIFGKSFISKGLIGIRNFIKRIVNKGNYFEQYGFKYVGVVDGHNIKSINKIMPSIKELAKEKAVFLHVKTTKGKGFKEAEKRADAYHGVGENLSQSAGSFSKCLGETLNELIEKDNKIVAITAGMKDGTGLSIVEEKHPENFIDVGIAEEYAVTYAAGMAMGGLKPVVAIYSTFMQRAYDQILHDVCMQNLPVVFCLDRAGFVGQDGKTHQGLFDLSYLSHIPNVKIYAPNTCEELAECLKLAIGDNCPVAIRYPKSAKELSPSSSVKDFPFSTVKSNGKKATLMAVGPNMLSLALSVANELEDVSVISARRLKPLDEKTLDGIENSLVITLEENVVSGGFGSSVREYFAKRNANNKIVCLGAENEFISHASIQNQIKLSGLTKENVIEIINKNLI